MSKKRGSVEVVMPKDKSVFGTHTIQVKHKVCTGYNAYQGGYGAHGDKRRSKKNEQREKNTLKNFIG